MPLYTAEEHKNGANAARHFAGEALALLMAFLVPFSILLMFFMPYVIQIMAPGFTDEPEKFEAAVSFSRIAFPYLALISITALQGGVLNAHGRFGPAAAAPIALNIVMIAGLLIAHFFHLPVGSSLSWAFVVSGAVQALWLAISCYRAGLTIPMIIPRLSEMIRKLFKQIGPGAIGSGAAQINILLSTILASTLPTGAVSYLFYADRLNQLPLGIVGIAVATTLLPLLSRYVVSEDHEAVRHYMSRAIEFCLLLGLPAAVGLALGAEPIIQTLFERGEFSHVDTIETSKALTAYSLGVPAFLLVKVFSSIFFARHDTRTPVRIAIISMITNVVCALLLLGVFKHVGIAFATSLATWVNAGQLYYALRKRGEKIGDEKLFRRVPRLFVCAGGMAIALFVCIQYFGFMINGSGLLEKIVGLGLIIGLSSVAYAVLLQVTGAMRWGEVKSLVKREGN